MTFKELRDAIHAICPEADFACDNYGQIVVYTNFVREVETVRNMTDEDWKD